ncbi:MAG: DUF5719 family protein [Actinomycetota bacterium]|nr:DUF5719 family protein [Actinomycetota bacterium]
MRAPTSTPTAFMMVALGIVAGVALDLLTPAASDPPATTAAGPAVSGAWYCAAGDTATGNGMFVITAVPPGSATGSVVRVDTVGGGEIARGAEAEVFAGGVRVDGLPPERAEAGVSARWWRTPAAVTRVWVRGQPGEPAGLVEGPCVAEPSPTWYLPGVNTAGGAQAAISLVNPFDVDAAVAVDLLTPDGVQRPERLKNVGIPARTVKTIPLNEHAPELADLGAVVRLRAGRVVAEAWQSMDPAVGGVEGMTLAPLAPAPQDTWTVPWVRTGDAESWLWVANTSEGPASLAVTVHTPDGGAPPEGLEELTVPGESVHRIDLRGALPEDVRSAGVTVTSSNGVPVVVSAATRITNPDPERTGFSILLGEPAPDPQWVISTGPLRGRHEVLHLVNPTSQPLTVEIIAASATSAVSPDDWRELAVPPGAAIDVDISAEGDDLDQHAIFVQADGGGVVAGLHSVERSGPMRLLAHAGVPSRLWAGGQPVPPVRFAPGLPQRLGTSLGAAIRSGTITDVPDVPTPTASPVDAAADTTEPAPAR